MILSATDNAAAGMTTLLLVLCGIVIMIVLLRRHQFRSATGRDMAREQLARIRDQNKLRNSLDELLVQLEEASRRVGAQLDTKFAKLETVIRDADDRLARLEHALGPLGDRPAQTPASAEPAARRAQGRGGGRDRVPSDDTTSGPGDPRFQRVCELVDAGATPIQAAEELGMPLGEVELILNLRKLR
jgi:hypothetical protein